LPGSGTQQDPWRIQSLADFDEFAANPNYWAGFTRLETDVNLAGRTYSTAIIAPDVNNANYDFDGTAFTGVFDGNDHKITNLTIDDGGAGNDFLGLFGFIGEDGQVSNLGIQGGSVSGNWYVGGLVGQNGYGSISNCYSTGDVNGVGDVGGLVGFNHGIISNCYSAGDVNGYDSVGGLVGENRVGSVSNCYSTVDVKGTRFCVGGLVGENWYGNVSNCYSIGSVTGSDYVGGLIGWCYESYIEGFWDVQTSGIDYSAGGTGKMTAEMKTKSTFTDAGWDFVEIWGIGENQTYPFLRFAPAGDFNYDKKVDFFDLAILASHWLEGITP
jgi:hypothetical protein